MDEKSAIRLWQKTKYANLVRNASSGKYFARFRSNGKLFWRGLDTDVLSTAAQRLPDKIKEARDEQELLASGSDPRITFEAAAKMYIERINASPDFKRQGKVVLSTRSFGKMSARSRLTRVQPSSKNCPMEMSG